MIVVIAILAAIVIVAYNGITQRARVATVNSDLEGAAKQLAIDQTLNSAYPATVAAANNGTGLKASAGTTYQYAVNNTASPQTFCITATNGTISYYASSTNNVPTAGGCPVTNLVANPSFETDANGYCSNTGSPTIAISNLQAYSGTESLYLTSTIVSTDVAPCFVMNLTPGAYILDYMVYSPAARTSVYFDWTDTATGQGGSQVDFQSISANTWTRISGSITISGTSSSSVAIYLHNNGGPNASGQVVFIDAIMLTQGSTLYNYADGSSPNWVWNGTANASTSTGPPL